MAAAVSAGLGIREQPGVAAADAVARVLARQQLLLVLDNCERVIGAAAELCSGLLFLAEYGWASSVPALLEVVAARIRAHVTSLRDLAARDPLFARIVAQVEQTTSRAP